MAKQKRARQGKTVRGKVYSKAGTMVGHDRTLKVGAGQCKTKQDTIFFFFIELYCVAFYFLQNVLCMI